MHCKMPDIVTSQATAQRYKGIQSASAEDQLEGKPKGIIGEGDTKAPMRKSAAAKCFFISWAWSNIIYTPPNLPASAASWA